MLEIILRQRSWWILVVIQQFVKFTSHVIETKFISHSFIEWKGRISEVLYYDNALQALL